MTKNPRSENTLSGRRKLQKLFIMPSNQKHFVGVNVKENEIGQRYIDIREVREANLPTNKYSADYDKHREYLTQLSGRLRFVFNRYGGIHSGKQQYFHPMTNSTFMSLTKNTALCYYTNVLKYTTLDLEQKAIDAVEENIWTVLMRIAPYLDRSQTSVMLNLKAEISVNINGELTLQNNSLEDTLFEILSDMTP